MATIIEGALWTLTEEAAMLMVDRGYLKACDSDHDLIEEDQPIFHMANDHPDWLSLVTLPAAIADAERAVYEDLLFCMMDS